MCEVVHTNNGGQGKFESLVAKLKLYLYGDPTL
jgi:hypothetical protein